MRCGRWDARFELSPAHSRYIYPLRLRVCGGAKSSARAQVLAHGDYGINQSNSTPTFKALPWPESETGHLAGMGLCLRLLCGGDVRLTCLRR